MAGLPQPDKRPSSLTSNAANPDSAPPTSATLEAGRSLDESELEAALQLLVERAQYITGATGTALALPQGDEMVCRASAGSCAPAIGARLQVQSGLTGESIARRQILRCDNAETDPRVNLETCRALGISSIVVLPLLRKNGEVRGLFELFSDHPYAFEERDLIALERMADLTATALDLAEQRHGAIPPAAALPAAPLATAAPTPQIRPAMADRAAATPAAVPNLSAEASATAPIAALQIPTTAEPVTTQSVAPAGPISAATPVSTTTPSEIPTAPADTAAEEVVEPSIVETVRALESLTPAATLPEAMRRVQKCVSCGFPVSEGRTYCLDCEKKQGSSPAKGPVPVPQISRASDAPAVGTQGVGAPGIGAPAIATQTNEASPVIAASGPESPTAGNSSSGEPAPEGQSDVGLSTDGSLALAPTAEPTPAEELPAFLANAQPVKQSWLADHVNVLAIVVAVLGILVAVVVFSR